MEREIVNYTEAEREHFKLLLNFKHKDNKMEGVLSVEKKQPNQIWSHKEKRASKLFILLLHTGKFKCPSCRTSYPRLF